MWITSHSWQQALSYKNKRQSMLAHNTKLLSYLIFLSNSNFSSIKVKPFWLFEFTSHLWQQALSYKKRKARVIFAHIANKYGIMYLPQLHWSSSNFLSINITAFWLPNGSWQQAALLIPPKTAKFWNYVWKRISMSQQLFLSWKTKVFAGIFSYFGALSLKQGLFNAVASEWNGIKPKKLCF